MWLEDNEEMLLFFIERDLIELAIKLCYKHFSIDKALELKQETDCVKTKFVITNAFKPMRIKVKNDILYS